MKNARLTLIENANGHLTKRGYLENGKLKKDASRCRMSRGTATQLEIPCEPSAIADVLNKIAPNQALTLGITEQKQVPIVTKRMLTASSNALARTRENFDWPNGPGFMLIDHDGDLPAYEVMRIIHEVAPEFKGVGYAHRPSTSSHVYGTDGTQYSGDTGQHIWIPVTDARQIPQIMKVLVRRLWSAGYGHIMISKDGKLLERTIVDPSVASPERLVFEYGMDLDDDLEQRRPLADYVAGTALDPNIVKPLTDEEERIYCSLVNKAKREKENEAKRIRYKYVGDEATKLVEESGISPERARRTVESRVAKILIGDDLLYFDGKDQPVTVSEVLSRPEEFDGKTLADPIEPEYGGGTGKAIIYINENSGSPLIHSFAHGGSVYKLKHDYRSARAYVEQLKKEHGADAVVEEWLRVLDDAHMRDDERQLFLKKVKELTGIGIMSLKSSLKQYRRERAKEKRSQSAKFDHLDDVGDFIAQTLLHESYSQGDLLMQTEDGSYWRYTATLWVKVKDKVLKNALQSVTKRHWASVESLYDGRIAPLATIIDQAIKVLSNHIVRTGDFLHSNSLRPAVINCANGELWLEDGGPVLKPHSPASGLTWCSDVAYEPGALCPLFTYLLHSMFCKNGGTALPDMKDLVRHVEELMGYMIQPGRFIKAFYIWVGDGDNGKGKLVDVILKLIGNDAAFMGRLDRMEDDKLRLAELHQKLVAVDDDAGRDFLFPDGFAKKASELKVVTAQYKHKDTFNFTLQVVMLVMANHWVTLRDLSRGMKTRAQVVKFPRSFLRPDEVEPDHPDIQRPEYWDKVFKEEMSGVLNCLIAGFYRLKNRGSFDQPKSCEYARDEWFQNANTVARFVSEGCKRNSNSAVDLREFRRAYFRWSEDEGIQPRYVVSKNMIKKHITDLGYEMSDRNGYPHVKGLEVTYEPMGWTRFAK